MCFEVALRFIIFFVGSVAIQLLRLHYAAGLRRLYAPFVYLIKPLVVRHYGGGDGSLGPLILWGLIVGTFVYSALLAFVGVFLTRKIAPEPSSGP
jgi:hypothetical protein